jgi:7-cyano-7-deazaguanine synthase
MKKKAIVLLSGGIDSTTFLAMAVKKYGAENVLAVTAYYAQKHRKEMVSASKVAQFYNVDQTEANLSKVYRLSDCPLLMTSLQKIKHESYAEQLAKKKGTVDTYVPFRNGLFLSYAAAIAISVNAEAIYYGAHADDAAGRAYPDCTPEFVSAMNTAIYEGSGGICHLEAPLLNMNKSQVVKEGLLLKAPYHLTWSCYEGWDKPCGQCGTCIDRAKAFKDNGVPDPALEENDV